MHVSHEIDGKETQRGGFTFTVRTDLDDYGEPDGLGKFTSDWEEGALDHLRKSSYNTRGHHRWFVPDYTVKQRRADLSASGYSKGEAERLARAGVETDYRRADAFGDDWHFLVVTVTASRCGIELATASLGGIESDGDESYLDETVDDLVHEALGKARDALNALVESVSPLERLAKCVD